MLLMNLSKKDWIDSSLTLLAKHVPVKTGNERGDVYWFLAFARASFASTLWGRGDLGALPRMTQLGE
jgi:hypothetical protein